MAATDTKPGLPGGQEEVAVQAVPQTIPFSKKKSVGRNLDSLGNMLGITPRGSSPPDQSSEPSTKEEKDGDAAALSIPSKKLKHKLRDSLGIRRRSSGQKSLSSSGRRGANSPLRVQGSSDSLTKRTSSLSKRVAPKLPMLPPSPDLGGSWDMPDKENPLRAEKWWNRQKKQSGKKSSRKVSSHSNLSNSSSLPKQLEPLSSSSGAYITGYVKNLFGYQATSSMEEDGELGAGGEGDQPGQGEGEALAESKSTTTWLQRSMSMNAVNTLDEAEKEPLGAVPPEQDLSKTVPSSPMTGKTRANAKVPSSPGGRRLNFIRLGTRTSGNGQAPEADAEPGTDGNALTFSMKNQIMPVPGSSVSRGSIPGILDPAVCFGIARTGQRLVLEDSLDDEVMEAEGEEPEPLPPKVARIPLQTHESIAPGAVGLRNLGNTCFINTALQCILHTPHLLPNFLPAEELGELDAILKARKERLALEKEEKAKSQSLSNTLLSLTIGGRKESGSGPLSPSASLTTLPSVPESSSAPEQPSGGDPAPEAPAAAAAEEPAAEEEDQEVQQQHKQDQQQDDCVLEDVTTSRPGSAAEDDATEKNGPLDGDDGAAEGSAMAADTETAGEATENAVEGGEGKQEVAEEGEEKEEGAEAEDAEAEAPPLVPEKAVYVKGSMAAEFKSILKALLLAETKSIDPSELIKVIGTHPFGSELCDGGQHDCQEIMRVLMDSLHEDLNRAKKIERSLLPDAEEKGISEFEKADRVWQHYMNFDSSPITDLYSGQFQSAVTCHQCGCKVTTYEPFLDLSLPITKEAIAKKGGFREWLGSTISRDLTLDDCVRAFTADETLTGEEGYMCETCKEVTDATKRVRIHRFPNTLIVHLKRFKCTATSREKIHHMIGFPVTELRLHDFATEESGYRKGDATYDLVGLCNHTGTMAGGHYTSACKVQDGEGGSAWHNFNDGNVVKLQASNVVSHSAYILFYALRPPGDKSKKKKHGKSSKASQQSSSTSVEPAAPVSSG